MHDPRAELVEKRVARTVALVLVGLIAAWVAAPPGVRADPVEVRVPLPTLPAPHLRYPGLFDERGCALLRLDQLGATRTVCPVLAPPSDSRSAGRHDWRKLLGFVGPYYASAVRGTGVVVLPESVGTGAAQEWSAVGLVRNDTLATVSDIEVIAHLIGVNGSVLATERAAVPVNDVRPGEPAPFAIASAVPRRAVVEVRWSALSHAVRHSAAVTRMVEISLARILSLGDRAPAGIGSATLPSRETTPAPREVAWGSVRSWAPRTIHRPSIVALGLDADGRGVLLLPGLVARRSGDGRASRSVLRRGDVAPFVLFLPEEGGARSGRPAPQRLAFWESAS